MKKLTLDLDDLKVESFETAGTSQGTVFGYDPVSCPTCGQATCSTCQGQYTCDPTCPDTCEFTCSRPIVECIGSSGGSPCP
jgi:hypothetical protein